MLTPVIELPRDEIIKSVSAQKLPDAATLADYLQRILQQEAQRLRTNELIELDDVTFGFDHARKMLWLADTLHDLPGGERLALRVIVSYVTELLLSTALCTSAYVTVHDRLQHRLSQRIHLRGDKSKRGAKTRPFLDLAGAASQLLAVYLTTDYDDPNHEDSLCVYNEHGGRECFHTGSRPILKSLLQSAYGEVRSKVMLTIGTLLPAELADEVVGWALVAEGLPSRPQEYVATDVLTDFGLLNICPVMENIIEKRRRALLET